MNTTIEKEISLKDLNMNGNLVLSFKKFGFESNNKIFYYSKVYKPTTCYLHSYKGKFIVTDYIINKRQHTYENYKEAENAFYRILEGQKEKY